MKKPFLIILSIVWLAISASWGGDLSRLGTTSASQLLIPIGARSISLGGASLGSISGTEAIYWNPAGISASRSSEVLFNNMSYIADIDVNYLALVYNGGSLGAFALHIKSLDFGDINETTEFRPDGTGNTFSPSFIVAGLSYSRLLTDRINVGITGKLISESVMETGATAFAFDLGVQYRFTNGLWLGVVMKNVGGKMQYDGRNLERQFDIPGSTLITDDGFFRGVANTADIPSTFGFGLAYTLNLNDDNSLTLSGSFTNQNSSSDEMIGGVEYAFRELFFLRGGYNYQTQSSDDQIFGAALGAGIQYPIGNFNFSLDYAFRQLTDYFDSNNIFTVKLAFR